MDARPELADIVSRSATLVERLGAFGDSDQPAHRSRESAARLERWRRIAADGDEERFDRRLRWDGIAHGDAERALDGPVRVACAADGWASLLDEAGALRAIARGPGGAGSHATSALPFEDLLGPFVRAALLRLGRHADACDAAFLPPARRDLEQGLRRHLSGIAWQALWSDFSALREEHGGPRAGDALYRAFVAERLGAGWLGLWRRYPVLARLLATRALDWVEATAEMAHRVLRSRDALASALRGGGRLGRVSGLRLHLSDSHARGRSVAILRFETGAEVVYKPRSLAPERSYYAFVEWLNRQGRTRHLGTLWVIDEGAFGWMQLARPQPCRDRAAVARYYERAGVLLGLAYALGYADLHSQNLIASGEQPLLVDLEVAMRPHWQPLETSGRDPLAGSVLRSHLLPYPVVDLVKRRARTKGGYATAPARERWWREEWQDVNTDAMRRVRRRLRVDDSTHAPRLRGAVLDVAPFVADVRRGFEALYDCLVARRAELLGPEGPLAGLVGQPCRVVLRNTTTYLELIRRSLQPELLRSGVDRSIELEVLARDALRSEQPSTWKAVGVEIRSVERLDVPAFHARVAGRDLETGEGEPMPGFFAESGYEQVRRRLEAMGDEDRCAQSELIRGRLADYAVGRDAVRHERAGADGRLSRGSALREAQRLSALLQALAQPGARGPAWSELVRTAPAPAVAALGPGLFTGTGGIALFLAAAARTAGQPLRLAPLLDPLGTTQRSRAARGREIAESHGVGAEGLGGVAYVHARVASWSGDARGCDTALGLLGTLGAEATARDRCDLRSGLAGALLALLVVHEVTSDPRALAAARRCGTELLDRRCTHPGSGLRAWADPSGALRSGWTRGTAGIAYALRRLHRVTGDADLLAAAREGERFEDRLLLPETGDWLETAPRPGESPRLATPRGSLSAGAAGIGIARLACGGGEAPRRATARACTAAALQLLEARRFAFDALGDGRLGAIALLRAAAPVLRDKELRARTGAHLAGIVARARLHGHYDLDGDPSLRPGLFRGLAGIGFTLLDHARPRERPLSKVLLLQ
jgi:class II lanthipeptide synthase